MFVTIVNDNWNIVIDNKIDFWDIYSSSKNICTNKGTYLLFSKLVDNFISFFFLLVFILMSGIFTPTESMPMWAQKINIINPFYYFMRVIRMILLKGSGFWDISREFFSLLFYAFLSVYLDLLLRNGRYLPLLDRLLKLLISPIY